MVSTLLLILLNKGSHKRKTLHQGLRFGRKKIPSDSFTFLISCMVWVVVWVRIVFNSLFQVFFFYKKKEVKISKIKKHCVFVYTGTCIPWMAFETKFLTLYNFRWASSCIIKQCELCSSFMWFVWFGWSLILHILNHSFWREGLENPKRKS